MRAGDFSEVAAAYSSFRLYNPYTGGAGRRRPRAVRELDDPREPDQPAAQTVLGVLPAAEHEQDLNSNQLADDYVTVRTQYQHRDNYDLKLTYQRNALALDLGASSGCSTTRASVDNFILGFDEPAPRRHADLRGRDRPHLDAQPDPGARRQLRLPADGPDGDRARLRHELRPRRSGSPASTAAPTATAACPPSTTATTSAPRRAGCPLFRTEKNWTFSSALTKVFPKHEVRVGFDFVRLELNHFQAEFGDLRPEGRLHLQRQHTGAPGYTSPGWNQFAAFLLGLPNSYSKDFQEIQMTGRENQFALYVRDRWNVTEKLTLSLGVRMEYYPLMTRADSGIERLDLHTWTLLIGGRGDVPEDVGINLKKMYFAPRLGAMYRLTEKSVIRAGYGRTVNPLPWSRPMRGAYPYDVFLQQRRASSTAGPPPSRRASRGSRCPTSARAACSCPSASSSRTPEPNNVDRAIIQQWNVAFEQRLPWDISAEVAYVGTATDGGYADLNINYGEPGGGNAARKYFAVAGTNTVNSWGSRTKSRYKGLQFALNRPFRNGLMLKGAYTLSEAKDMTTNGEDGWVGLTWNHPLKYDDNFALAGLRPHAHRPARVPLRAAVPEEQPVRARQDPGRLAAERHRFVVLRYAVLDRRHQHRAQLPGLRLDPDQLQRRRAEADRQRRVGHRDLLRQGPLLAADRPTYDGFGNSQRTLFRRPNVWNVDMSLFKSFQIGRVRPEIRIEVANVFNHPNWGEPGHDFTANNFLMFIPANADSGTGTASGATNTPGPRIVQIGLRLQF